MVLQRTGGIFGILGIFLVGIIVGVSPPATAGHWCPSILISTSPSTVAIEDRVPYTVTVTNNHNATISTTLRVRFPWDTQTASWGTLVLAPGQSKTSTYGKFVGGSPGDHSVSVVAQGNATGEAVAACTAVQRPLRVEPAVAPPVVILFTNTTTGTAPLPVQLETLVTGGSPPLEYRWPTSGLDWSGNATNTVTLDEPGQNTVTVLVRDARGRVSTASVMISVGSGLSLFGASPAATTPSRLEAIRTVTDMATLALLAIIVWAVLRRKSETVPASPMQATQALPKPPSDSETSDGIEVEARLETLSARLRHENLNGADAPPAPGDVDPRLAQDGEAVPVQTKSENGDLAIEESPLTKNI